MRISDWSSDVCSSDLKTGRAWGHLAFRVDDIYATCQKLQDNGVTLNRPPRDGYLAFVKSPDGISINLLQNGEAKAAPEPWASMANTGRCDRQSVVQGNSVAVRVNSVGSRNITKKTN